MDATQLLPIFTESQAEGAVVAMLRIGDFKDQNWIQVQSPRGQSDLVTMEHTIASLIEARDALRMTVATGMTPSETEIVAERPQLATAWA